MRGFRLGVRVDEPVPIFVAALRERMLRLAAREGDGAIINWLSAQDATRVCGIVRDESPTAEIVARIFVLPTPDREAALATGRFILAAYLNVPVYRAFHTWLGRTDALGEHWASGRRVTVEARSGRSPSMWSTNCSCTARPRSAAITSSASSTTA